MGESRNTWIDRGKRLDSIRLAQIKEDILGALKGEGRNDHIAAALEGVRDRRVHFFDGRLHLFVKTIAVGGLHDHYIGLGRRRRITQQGPPGVAEVAGEQDRTPLVFLLSSRNMQAEPRIWPASRKVAFMPEASSRVLP